MKAALRVIVCALSGGLMSLAAQEPVVRDRSVSELIAYLTYQSPREHAANYETGTFGCGQAVADQQAAVALTAYGEKAVREIENEITRTMIRGERNRRGWYWLTCAYASIGHDRAFPFLDGIASRIWAESLQLDVDDSIAISLNLTSYVSASRPLSTNIPCVRGFQPRDALDRVVLGVLKRNRKWLETGLNTGQEGLGADVLGSSMSAWLESPVRSYGAVGYTFEGADAWSDVPLSLLPRAKERRLPEAEDTLRFVLRTKFSDSRGRICGEERIFFRRVHDGASFRPFVVEQDNLDRVLGTIRTCAERGLN